MLTVARLALSVIASIVILLLAQRLVPTTAEVSVANRNRNRLRIVRPSRLNAWFRRRWLPPAAVTGDAAFDSEWSIDTRDREFAAALAREPGVRQALRTLEAFGTHVVAQTGKRLVAKVRLPPRTAVQREAVMAGREGLARRTTQVAAR